MKNIILFLMISLISISCNNKKSISDKKNNGIEGFWNRLGTIKYVNNIPVDTTYIKDSDFSWFKQVKVFKHGNMIWLNNARDTLTPWKGGSGGYAKFVVHSPDSITEKTTNGTGAWGSQIKNYKDSLNVSSWTFGLQTDISENYYSQKWGGETVSEYAEFWGRMDKLQEKTKFDGAWKRVYQINFVNGIAVDTTSVPSDAVLDVKIFSDGYYSYQVDQTGLVDLDKPGYGGYGGHGTFEYDEEKKILTEYQEWGSGMQTNTFPPKSNPIYHNIKFYNDDLFLQVGVDSNTDETQTGRGLVYKRIN